MNRKIIIGICSIVVIFVLILVLKNKNNASVKENVLVNEEEHLSLNIFHDENTGEYVLYNEETYEEIARNINEENLYIYKIDPTYEPRNPIPNETNE